MFRYFELACIFALLFAGFLLLLVRVDAINNIKKILMNAKYSLNEQDKEIKLKRRENLMEFQKDNSIWMWIDNQLDYAGLKRRFRGITAGKLMVYSIMLFCVMFVCGWMIKSLFIGLIMGICGITAECFIIQLLKVANLHRVNEELPKFLDFLGNYSLTSGELISTFSQISRYMDSPLRNVLEECEAESRVSGDSTLAILDMAEKIEHPQFKQLVRNIEITARYSADFGSLVSESRRSMREYLSQTSDRKGMLREAGINMGLLLVMSVIVLLTVNVLVNGGIWEILFKTMVGHLAMGGMGVILLLFAIQVFSLNK